MSQPLAIQFILEGKIRPVVYWERWGAFTSSSLFHAGQCLMFWNAMKDSWKDIERLLGKELSTDERLQIMLANMGCVVCEDDEDIVAPIMPLVHHHNNKNHFIAGIFTVREETGECYRNNGCALITVDLDEMTTELCTTCYYAADAFDEYFADDYDKDDPDDPYGGDAMKWFETLPEIDIDLCNIKMEEIKTLDHFLGKGVWFFRLKGDVDEVYMVED